MHRLVFCTVALLGLCAPPVSWAQPAESQPPYHLIPNRIWLHLRPGEQVVIVAPADLRNRERQVVRQLQVGEVFEVQHDIHGEVYFKDGVVRSEKILRLQDALDLFTLQLQFNPSAETYHQRAMVYAQQWRFDEAIDDLTAAIHLAPASAALLLRGWCREQCNKPALARQDYTDAIWFAPLQAEGYRRRVLLWQHDREHALQDFNMLVWLEPQQVNHYLNRGQLWLQLGDAVRALRDFDRAVALAPKDASLYRLRGETRAKLGQRVAALRDFDQAIKLAPKLAATYISRGVVEAEQHDTEQALADFSTALRVDPTNALAFSNRAAAWLKKGEPVRAINDLTVALRLAPDQPTPLLNRGLTWLQLGKYDLARADFEAVLQCKPDDADAHNALAWLLATCPEAAFRDGPRAVAAATKACELTEWKSPGMLDTLAAACAEAGGFALAVQYQRQAMELKLGDPQLLAAAQARLKLYQRKQPYREEVKR